MTVLQLQLNSLKKLLLLLCLNEAACLCFQGDRWISLPPMPTPRAGAAVAVLGKQILVVGGVGEDHSPLKVVEMYNTEEGRWRKRSSLREALMGVSITVKGMDT